VNFQIIIKSIINKMVQVRAPTLAKHLSEAFLHKESIYNVGGGGGGSFAEGPVQGSSVVVDGDMVYSGTFCCTMSPSFF
jgi:hypothetical protein